MKLSEAMHNAIIDAFKRMIADADDQRVKCAPNTLAALRRRGFVYPADTTIAFQLTPEGFGYGEEWEDANPEAATAEVENAPKGPRPRKHVETRAERRARGTRKYRREGTKCRATIYRSNPTNIHFKGKPSEIHAARQVG